MRQLALLLLATLAVARASVTVTQVSNDGPHPSTMEIEVQLPETNERVLIPLERTDAFENIPMTLLEKGTSRTFSSSLVHHASHAHYRDIASKAVISVRRHANGKRQVSGHVMHAGTSYFLEPVGDTTEHRVTKNTANPEVMARQVSVERLRLSRRKRQTNTSSTTNTVELRLLIDSTVWLGFINAFGNDSTALTELHYYYTHILNGIDTAYRNIGTPSISVSCIGMTISMSADQDLWMPGSIVGNDILTQMAAYIVDKAPADHYMAFTRIDITGSDGSPSVCGMAYVASACTRNRVSINEDGGLHCWGTAAHELGHNLGSQHDASGNTCGTTVPNLMSPSTGFYTINTVAQSYRFSNCSVNYINQYINSLGSTSCLLTSQGNRWQNLTWSDREGTRMTLDRVCLWSYPDSIGKVFVTNDMKTTPASICASIYCKMDASSGSSSGGLRAPVGTPCGSQKSCNWNGECVSDSAAPVADEKCFWGDSWPSTTCSSWVPSVTKSSTKCTSNLKLNCCATLKNLCIGY